MYRRLQDLKTRIKSFKEDGTLLGQLFVTDPVCFRAWAKKIPEIDRRFGRKERHSLTKSILILHEKSELCARSWVDFLTKEFLDLSSFHQKRAWRIAEPLLMNDAFLKLLLPEFCVLLTEYSDQELDIYLREAEIIFAESAEKSRFFLRQESQQAKDMLKQLQKITPLEELHQMLLLYGRARCGEKFQLQISLKQEAYCDGRNVILPETLPFPPKIGSKFYRLLMAKNTGFLEFGSMDFLLDDFIGWEWVSIREDELEIERMFRSFPSGLLAKEIFFQLENYRVTEALKREYTGIRKLFDDYQQYWQEWSHPQSLKSPIQKELFRFQHWLDDPREGYSFFSPEEREDCLGLKSTVAKVDDSIRLLLRLYPKFYAVLLSQQSPSDPQASEISPFGRSSSIQTNKLSQKDRKAERRAEQIQKEQKGKGSTITRQEARELDFSEASEFLDRNPGLSAPQQNGQGDGPPDFTMELSKKMTPLQGEFVYPEWDIRIKDWKPDWTKVREFILPSDHGAFQQAFFGEFQTDIQSVKRIFQAIRMEQEKPIRKQWDGDTIEFDRLLDASIAIQTKQDPDLRIYQRTHRNFRDIGVAFLVDMSSSTNELIEKGGKRIIDIEKQALFLIAEALYSLGDPFAIYGFSGFGREQVAFYIAKEMEEAWNEEAQARLGAMSWKMENRDGAAIRHCTAKMKSWKQKQKLLILLSDGKPLDCASGEYQEELAQMDTWRALQDAKLQGVRPFCITVDPHGKEYLEKMYGQGNYIAISSIETLPRKLPLIYRQLTGL